MNGTILLVDDSPMFIEIEKEFLQDSHVEVLTAGDGQEALHVVKTRRLSLFSWTYICLTWMGQPSAGKSDTAFLGKPVVMVTSKGKDENKDRFFSAGCDHDLTQNPWPAIFSTTLP